MKTLAFTLALAALVFACVDFFERGRRQLARARVLRTEIRALLGDGIARASRDGAPPTAQEVDGARALARTLARDASLARAEWFGHGERAFDWLLPPAARPAPASLAAERERIAQALLALPVELKPHPGITAARLGLAAPSLTDSFPTAQAELADQSERAVATRFLLATLRTLATPQVIDGSLTRGDARELVLRLDAFVTISDAVALYERLLGASDEAPPRRLHRFTLTREEPRNWGVQTKTLPAPPVRVAFASSFEFPAPSGVAR